MRPVFLIFLERMDIWIEKVSSDLVPFFFQSLKRSDGTVGAADVKEKSHPRGPSRTLPIQIINPDLTKLLQI